MNLREFMVKKSGQLTEMAAQELRKVEKDILAGDIEKAARDYIDFGGSPRSNAISKTVNSFLKKNPNISPDPFHAFRRTVVNIAAKEFPEKKLTYKKREISGVTKEGEKVTSGRTARAQKKMETDQLKGLARHALSSEEEKRILQSGGLEEKRKLASQMYDDQKNSGDVRALKAWVVKGDKPAAEIVDGKSKVTVDRNYILKVIKGHTEGISDANFDKKFEDKSNKEIGQAVSNLLGLWEKDLNVLKKFSQTGDAQKTAERIMQKSLEKGIENIKLLGIAGMEKRKLRESLLYEDMLKSTYGYNGNMFWENYALSNLVRVFPKYITDYGEEAAVDMFVAVYGEEAKPLFEYMVENKQVLCETASIVKRGLLFEAAGERNVEQCLNEIEGPLRLTRGIAGAAGAATTGGIGGFLKGLWGKLAELGKGALARIVPFLKAKVAWARNIATKGIGWIANNPIARVAVPAVLIAGGVVGAIAMINKLRKKMGRKKMSKEEEAAVGKITEKNKAKIERARRKAGQKEPIPQA